MSEEKKAFKTMTVGEKAEHIWEYYKPALLAIALGVMLIIYIIVKIVSPDPEYILNVVLGNASTIQGEYVDTFERYLEEEGYNPEEKTVSVNTNIYIGNGKTSQSSVASLQVLIAKAMVGDIDLLVGDTFVLDVLGKDAGLMEMESILTPEQMEQYGDRLYTVTDSQTGAEHVCGIRLSENNKLVQDGYYFGEVWVGIPVSAAHPELAKEVLMYLLEE